MSADTDPAIQAQIDAALKGASPGQATPSVGVPVADDDPHIMAQVHQALTMPSQTTAPSSGVPADAVQGANGLMWNAKGGYDPKTGELVIGGKPFSDVTADHPILSKIVAGTEGVLGGVPIAGPTLAGLPEKAAATARSITSGTPYDPALAATKGIVEQAQAANPTLTTAGNIAGTVAGLAPAAETALGARALGLVGTVPGRVFQGALGGAGISAADAYMRGQDTTQGAETGAALGMVSPIIGKAIGAAAGGAMNMMPGAVTGPLSSLNQTARNMLTTAFQNETPQSITAAASEMGPSGFAGELAHPALRLTKSIADQPIAAAGDIRTAYNQRAAADGGRIDSAISSALGPQQNLALITKNDQIAQSAAADPLYDAWRQTQIPPTDDLRALAPRLNAAGVAGPAANKMAISGTPGWQQWFKTDPMTGQMTLDTEKSPTAQTWDYMKQALDDKISSAYSSGEKGNARLYQGLKSDMISAIDNHPDPNVAGVWQAARQAWGDPQSIMSARDWGADMLKNSNTVDDLREEWGSKSIPEQVAAIQGLRGQVANVFGGTKTGDTLIKNQLLAPNAQAKLSYIIGPNKAQALTSALQQEDQIAARAKIVTGGSPTQENMQGSGLSGPAAIPGQIANWLKGIDLARPSTLVGANPAQMVSKHEANQLAAARGQIAPILTTPIGPNNAMGNALLSMANRQMGRNASAQNIQDMATLLGRPGAQLLPSIAPSGRR